jgi:diguanylate cyclase (GGDEF)-like protein
MDPTFGFAALALLALALAFAIYAHGRGGAVFASGLGAARERALASLGAGMVVIDGHGRVSGCNAEAKLLLDLADAPDCRMLPALRVIPELADILARGEGGAEIFLGEGSGCRRIEARAFPFSRAGRGMVLVLRDVTENAVLLEELAAQASHDPLTGVLNRRRFDELGERDIELSRRSGASVGVLMIDIDLFKRVNDERGHAVGDEVLKALCVACLGALRSSDVLARYGGEEFVVLLPGSGPEDSLMVAERLRARIGALRVPCEGGIVSITASFGAYSGVPSPGVGIGLYIRRADEALYRSKALGRDRVSFWKPLAEGALHENADRQY